MTILLPDKRLSFLIMCEGGDNILIYIPKIAHFASIILQFLDEMKSIIFVVVFDNSKIRKKILIHICYCKALTLVISYYQLPLDVLRGLCRPPLLLKKEIPHFSSERQPFLLCDRGSAKTPQGLSIVALYLNSKQRPSEVSLILGVYYYNTIIQDTKILGEGYLEVYRMSCWFNYCNFYFFS